MQHPPHVVEVVSPRQNGHAVAARVVPLPRRSRFAWSWVLVALVGLAAIVVALVWSGHLEAVRQLIPGQSTAAVSYQTATAARGTVAETVTATGPIAAAQALPLSFKSSGKLVELKVALGQKVKKGDLLAVLDRTDLQASVDQARASLAQQQANLDKLQAGATAEERAAAEVSLRNAERAAQDASETAAASTASAQQDVVAARASTTSSERSLQAAKDALAAAQDQAEQALAADQTAVDNARKALDAARNVVAASPAVLKQQLEKAKDDLWAAQITRDATCGRDHGAACQAANATVAGLETSVTQFNATSQQTQRQNEQTVQQAQNALDTARAALASDQAKQAGALKTAENTVKAAEASLDSALVGIGQAQLKAAASGKTGQQSTDAAQAQVRSAQASLTQTAAARTQPELDAQAAQVASARVALQSALNNLDAATLTAPVDGTVSAINGTIGQWINGGPVNASTATTTTAANQVITLITLDDLQVTANVNEADVGRIKIGDPVSFTVSAFPGRTFTGAVSQLQPTGTTTSNVVTFAVTNSITSLDGTALYPGMTASVTITTAERADVVLVPNSALTYGKSAQQGAATTATATARQSTPTVKAQGGGQGTVVALQGGAPVRLSVSTGMTDGTNTEVTAGLQEGQLVVTGQSGASTVVRSATGTTGSSTTGGTQRTGAQSSSPLSIGGPAGGPPPGPPPGG